jgi:putative ABC transport system substrate-binding protein
MSRRAFITLIGGAAAGWPLVAWAQQSARRRIGVLMSFAKDDPEDQLRRAALQDSLQQLGWFEDRNIQIEYR